MITNFHEDNKRFRGATGIEREFFNHLIEYLNPGEDYFTNVKHDTSKCLSEEKFTNSEEAESGPKPKLPQK